MAWFQATPHPASAGAAVSTQIAASAYDLVSASASISGPPLAPPAIKAEQFADHHAESRKYVERQKELMDAVVAVANGRRGDFTAAEYRDLGMLSMGTAVRKDAKGEDETFITTTEKFEPEEFDVLSQIRDNPDRL